MNSIVRFADRDVRAQRGAVRWGLFLDSDIRDVVLTDRLGTLRIVVRGRPDPAPWARLPTDAGFPEPRLGTVKHAPLAGSTAA